MTSYRVTTYLTAPVALHQGLTAVLAKACQKMPSGLAPNIEADKDGIDVTLRIEADDKDQADEKARYWLRKIRDGVKGLRWTGETRKATRVVLWR